MKTLDIVAGHCSTHPMYGYLFLWFSSEAPRPTIHLEILQTTHLCIILDRVYVSQGLIIMEPAP